MFHEQFLKACLWLAIQQMMHLAPHAQRPQRVLQHESENSAVRRVGLCLTFNRRFVLLGAEDECRRIIGAGVGHR